MTDMGGAHLGFATIFRASIDDVLVCVRRGQYDAETESTGLRHPVEPFVHLTVESTAFVDARESVVLTTADARTLVEALLQKAAEAADEVTGDA